jgi:hypothetical protein
MEPDAGLLTGVWLIGVFCIAESLGFVGNFSLDLLFVLWYIPSKIS